MVNMVNDVVSILMGGGVKPSAKPRLDVNYYVDVASKPSNIYNIENSTYSILGFADRLLLTKKEGK